MQKARIIGNYIEQLATEQGISNAELSEILGCKERQVKALMKGRMLASFEQLSVLAQKFGVSVSDLMRGDIEQYNQSVVHCVNQFSDINNREIILDLIDEYLDVLDAVAS